MIYTALAGLLYLVALLLPVYLLYRFRPLPWPVHALAVAIGLAIGFAPGTALLNSKAGTYLYGFAVVFLVVWGVAGFFLRRKGEAKNLAAKAG